MTAANLGSGTTPSYVADAATGRLAIGGHEIGDTGWRNVNANLENGWTTPGVWMIRRTGDMVSIGVEYNNLDASAATSNRFYTIPTGFRSLGYVHAVAGVADASLYGLIRIDGVSDHGIVLLTPVYTGQPVVRPSASWPTKDPWPTVLPGSEFTAPGPG